MIKMQAKQTCIHNIHAIFYTDTSRPCMLLLLKDMIAVIQPISAPIRRERVKMPKKSPNARKKACVSKPPVPDWYRSP